MEGIWKALSAAGMIIACAGCPHSKPNLKPTDQREQIVAPPNLPRYSDPNQALPKQAWKNREDPYIQQLMANPSNANMPIGRGMGMGMGPGGGY
jgi:hypothetical protein